MVIVNPYAPNRYVYDKSVNTYHFNFDIIDASSVDAYLLDDQGYRLNVTYTVDTLNNSVTFFASCDDGCTVVIERVTNLLQPLSFPCNEVYEKSLDAQIMVAQELRSTMMELELQNIKAYCTGCDISGGSHGDALVIEKGKIVSKTLPNYPIIPDITRYDVKEGDALSLAIPDKNVYCFKETTLDIVTPPTDSNSIGIISHYKQWGDIVENINPTVQVLASTGITDLDKEYLNLISQLKTLTDKSLNMFSRVLTPSWNTPPVLYRENINPMTFGFTSASGLTDREGIVIKKNLNGFKFNIQSNVNELSLMLTAGKIVEEVVTHTLWINPNGTLSIGIADFGMQSTSSNRVNWSASFGIPPLNLPYGKRINYELIMNYENDGADINVSSPSGATRTNLVKNGGSHGGTWYDYGYYDYSGYENISWYFTGDTEISGDNDYIHFVTLRLTANDVVTSPTHFEHMLFLENGNTAIKGIVKNQIMFVDGTSTQYTTNTTFVVRGNPDYFILTNFGTINPIAPNLFNIQIPILENFTPVGKYIPLSKVIDSVGANIDSPTLSDNITIAVNELISTIQNIPKETAVLTRKSTGSDITRQIDINSVPTTFEVTTGTNKGDWTFLIIKSDRLSNLSFLLDILNVSKDHKFLLFSGRIDNGAIIHTLQIKALNSPEKVIGLNDGDVIFDDGSHSQFNYIGETELLISGISEFLVVGNLKSIDTVDHSLLMSVIFFDNRNLAPKQLPIYYQFSDFVSNVVEYKEKVDISNIVTFLKSNNLLQDTLHVIRDTCNNAFILYPSLINQDLCGHTRGDYQPIRFGINVENRFGSNHLLVLYQPHINLKGMNFSLTLSHVDSLHVIIRAGRIESSAFVDTLKYNVAGETKHVVEIRDNLIIYWDGTNKSILNIYEPIPFYIDGDTDYLIIGNLDSNIITTDVKPTQPIDPCGNVIIDNTVVNTPCPCTECSPTEPDVDPDETYPTRCSYYKCVEQRGVLYFTLEFIRQYYTGGIPLITSRDFNHVLTKTIDGHEWSNRILPDTLTLGKDGDYLYIKDGQYAFGDITVPDPSLIPQGSVPIVHNGQVSYENINVIPDPNNHTNSMLIASNRQYSIVPNDEPDIQGTDGQILILDSSQGYKFVDSNFLPDPVPDDMLLTGDHKLFKYNTINAQLGNVGDCLQTLNHRLVWGSPYKRNSKYDFMLENGVIAGFNIKKLSNNSYYVGAGEAFFKDPSTIVHFKGGHITTSGDIFLGRNGLLTNVKTPDSIDLSYLTRINLPNLATQINESGIHATNVTLLPKNDTSFKSSSGYVIFSKKTNVNAQDPAVFKFIAQNGQLSEGLDTIPKVALLNLGEDFKNVSADEYISYNVYINQDGNLFIPYPNVVFNTLDEVTYTPNLNDYIKNFTLYIGSLIVKDGIIVKYGNIQTNTIPLGTKNNEVYVLKNGKITPSGVSLDDISATLQGERLLIVQAILEKQYIETPTDKWSGNTIFDNYVAVGSYINRAADATASDTTNHLRIGDIVHHDTPAGVNINEHDDPYTINLQDDSINYTWNGTNAWLNGSMPNLTNTSSNPIQLIIKPNAKKAYAILKTTNFKSFKFGIKVLGTGTVNLYSGNVGVKNLQLSDLVTYDTSSAEIINDDVDVVKNLLPVLTSMAADTLTYTAYSPILHPWLSPPKFSNTSSNPIRLQIKTSRTGSSGLVGVKGTQTYAIFRTPKNLRTFSLSVNAEDFHSRLQFDCFAGNLTVVAARVDHGSLMNIFERSYTPIAVEDFDVDKTHWTGSSDFLNDYIELFRGLNAKGITHTYRKVNGWGNVTNFSNTTKNPISVSFTTDKPAGNVVLCKPIQPFLYNKFNFKYNTTNTEAHKIVLTSAQVFLGNPTVNQRRISDLVHHQVAPTSVNDLSSALSVAHNLAADTVTYTYNTTDTLLPKPILSNVSTPINIGVNRNGSLQFAIFKIPNLVGVKFKLRTSSNVKTAKIWCKAGRIVTKSGTVHATLNDFVRTIDTTEHLMGANIIDFIKSMPDASVAYTKGGLTSHWLTKPRIDQPITFTWRV